MSQLPEAEQPQVNEIRHLALYRFNIPNMGVMRDVVRMTVNAATEISRELHIALLPPASSLLDAEGKPLISASAESPAKKVAGMVDGLLREPLLHESYALGSTPDGSDAPEYLANLNPASLKLTVITFTLLGQVVAGALGPQITEHLAPQMDSLLILLMQGVNKSYQPMDVFKAAMTVQLADPSTGVPLVGDHPIMDDFRLQVCALFLGFLIASEFAETTVTPEVLTSRIRERKVNPLDIRVTPRGERLRLHLLSALSFKHSQLIKQQEMAEASKSETVTESAVQNGEAL